MRSRKMALNQLVEEIIVLYRGLIPEKTYSDKAFSNHITKTITYLKNTNNISDIYEGKASNQEMFQFFKLLLDVVGLESASEGCLNPIRLGNTSLIGKKRDLKGVYKGEDNSVDENMCAILFQGWVKTANTPYGISKDLRNELPKESKACDFLLKSENGLSILAECKRVHSSIAINNPEELVERVINKATNWVANAINQFESTEKFLGSNKYYRYLVFDISDYGKDCTHVFNDYTIVGLLDNDEISRIIPAFEALKIEGIDEIVFCWSNLYLFEGKPRALAYYTIPLKTNHKANVTLGYSGWTIEYYPMGKQTEEYRELRISSIARAPAWIRTSWYGYTDQLITFGEIQQLE